MDIAVFSKEVKMDIVDIIKFKVKKSEYDHSRVRTYTHTVQKKCLLEDVRDVKIQKGL
jgi:hypothetical protein